MKLYLSIIAIVVFLSTIPTSLFAKEPFKIPLYYDTISLNPANFADTNSIWIGTQIYDGLFEITPSGDITPRLVKDWHTSSDGKTHTFSLKKNIFFSDGTPFTAKDVKFTFKYLKENSKRERHLLSKIKEIKLINDHELQVIFRDPAFNFPKILTSPSFFILPVKYSAQINKGTFFKNPIGTGPYKIHKWTRGKELVLQTNKHYWGNSPSLNEIVFSFLDPSKPFTDKDLLKYNLILGIPAYNLNIPNGFRAEWYNHPVVEFLGFNLEHPFWKDLKNREAFTKLFHEKQYYNNIFQHRKKSWHLANSVIPYGLLNIRSNPNHSQNVDDNDLKRVKSYLRKNKPSIYFTSHEHIAKEQLSKALETAFISINDIEFNIQKVSPTDLLKKLKSDKVDFFFTRFSSDGFDPYEILVYFSNDAPEKYFNVNDRYFTELLHIARQEPDNKKRASIYRDLAHQINIKVLAIPIASMFSERLFIREDCKMHNQSPLGPWHYKMDRIKCGLPSE